MLTSKFQFNFDQNITIFMTENAFKNVACNITAILFQLQCVDETTYLYQNSFQDPIVQNWTSLCPCIQTWSLYHCDYIFIQSMNLHLAVLPIICNIKSIQLWWLFYCNLGMILVRQRGSKEVRVWIFTLATMKCAQDLTENQFECLGNFLCRWAVLGQC